MKFIRHILLVLALLFSARPCAHAESDHSHEHAADDVAHICALNLCECHSCDESSHPDEALHPRTRQFDPVSKVPAAPLIVLFSVPAKESPPQELLALLLPDGALAAIRTICLLT